MSNTPEIDEVEKYSGVTIKDSVTTCGDESSSVYIPVIFARQLERERDEAIAMVEKLMEHGFDMMDENRALKREIKQLKQK